MRVRCTNGAARCLQSSGRTSDSLSAGRRQRAGFRDQGGHSHQPISSEHARLSVDIDLTYLPISDRDTALTGIRTQLAKITEALRRTVPGVNIQLVEGDAPKLLVDRSGARIKSAAECRRPRQLGTARRKRTVLGRAGGI